MIYLIQNFEVSVRGTILLVPLALFQQGLGRLLF